jgi:hypothetical protein
LDFSAVFIISTTALILAFGGILTWFGRGFRRLTTKGHLSVMLAGVLGAIGVLVVMLLISGLLFFRASIYPIYLVGLSWILAMGVFHFCMLVLSIQIQDEGT